VATKHQFESASDKASEKASAAPQGTVGSAGEGALNLSFEEAMERLEAIVEKIEAGEVGLEEAIREYEQGMALVRRCKDVLARAEQRVQELSRDALGAEGSGERR
jgi:exodeoxyribonuclease VII small subunit